MEDMISCPRRWYFERFLRLKTPDGLEVTSGSLMMGKLAHKIVENIYAGKKRIDEDEAFRLAGIEFDRLAPSMAAELLLPGSSTECKRQKNILTGSVKNLVRQINARNLVVTGSETGCSGNIHGIDFTGRLDLELRDEQGNLYIIDMKWSFDKNYGDKLRSGKSVQFAVYSALANKTNSPVRCAYYIFNYFL